MDIGTLTTVYDARDEGQAVTDKVLGRERAATQEIANQQRQRAASATEAATREVAGHNAAAQAAEDAARRARKAGEDAVSPVSRAPLPVVDPFPNHPQPTHPSAVDPLSGLTVSQQQSAAASLQRQRNSALVAEWKKAEADRVAATKKAEAEIEQTLSKGLVSRRTITARIADAVGVDGIFQKFQGAKAVAGELDEVAKGAAAAGGQVGALAGGMSSAAGAAGGMLAGLGPILTVLGGLLQAAAAVGVAIGSMAKHAADVGAKFHDLSIKTNFSVETLSTLDKAARLGGSSLEAITGSLVIFNRNLEGARNGTGAARNKFRELNVDLRDNEAALNAVLDRLAALPPGAQRSAEAMKFFGRSGTEVLKIIGETNGNLDELKRTLGGEGALISTAQAEAADKFGDTLDKIGMRAEALSIQIGAKFIPALQTGLNTIDREAQQAQRGMSTLGTLIDVVAVKAMTEFKSLEMGLLAINQQLAPALAGLQLISDYSNDNPSVPAPKMPETGPVPVPPGATPEYEAGEVIQVAKRELAQAERTLRAVQFETQRLRAAGVISPLDATTRLLAAEQAASERRVGMARAEMQALKAKRDQLEFNEDTAAQHQQLEGQISQLEEQQKDERAKAEQERLTKMREAQEEEKRLRRDAAAATVRQIMSEAASVAAADSAANEGRYREGLRGLETYNQRRRTIEEARYKEEGRALDKEMSSAGLITNAQERERAQKDIQQREREALRRHETAITQIGVEERERRRQLDRQFADEDLRIRTQEDAHQLTLLHRRLQRGDITNEDYSREESTRRVARLKDRIGLENVELARLLRQGDMLPQLPPGLGPAVLAERMTALTVASSPNVDVDKLNEAKQRVLSALNEYKQALLETEDAAEESRRRDADDAARWADQLYDIHRRISNMELDSQQSQITALSRFPGAEREVRDAQRLLDIRREQVRFLDSWTDANARLSKAGLMQDPLQRSEMEREVRREIQALEREHTTKLLEIDREYLDALREEQMQVVEQVFGVLSSALDNFRGDWGDLWRDLLQQALNVVKQIANELLHMGLEGLFTGETRGSSAGGWIGSISNAIGQKLFSGFVNPAKNIPTPSAENYEQVLRAGRESSGFSFYDPFVGGDDPAAAATTRAGDKVTEAVHAEGGKLYAALGDVYLALTSGPQGPGLAGQALLAFVSYLGAGIAAKWGGVVSGGGGGGGGGNNEGPPQPRPTTAPTLKRRGSGGQTEGATLVGEYGPELAFFDQPTNIVNNHETRNLLDNKTENNTYIIQQAPVRSRSYTQRRAQREGAEALMNLLKTRT